MPLMLNARPWIYLTTIVAFNCHGQNDPYKIDDLKQMSLTQLLELEVISPSRVEQPLIDAPANITVISQETIRQRGYKNLFEILEDLPGFDFASYEDGGGEYPNHSLNRGIGGGPGNPKLMIMVDGIVQNHIAFNWSLLFGEEQIYQDLERIEIIQGPVSAIYGANAFSGLIHFITHHHVDHNKISSTLWLGQHNSKIWTGLVQARSSSLHFNGAIKWVQSDGDNGIGRHDPAGYFKQNPWPNIAVQNYDQNGQYQQNTANPYANQVLSDGFNTHQDIWSIRANLDYIAPSITNNKGLTKASANLFVWNKQQGLGGYVPGYEYQTTAASFIKHHSAQSFTAKIDYQFNHHISATTSAWYRQNRQLPQTGFQYTYRFVDLVKSYHSDNKQWGIEQQLQWQLNKTDALQLGTRFIDSDKMDQVVSLGQYQNANQPITHSSWSAATAGDNPQLGLDAQAQVYRPKEQAIYSNFDGQFNPNMRYSAGFRIDHSDDYGTTTNPHLAIIYKLPNQWFSHWNIKLLYGRAFREPSIFELNDEFRGNRQLKPETIKTTELVSQIGWLSQGNDSQRSTMESITLKASLFYSQMQNLITLVPSANSDSGSVYANAEQADVRGASLVLDMQWSKQWTFYANYQYTQGNQQDQWQAIEHSASHKWNIGFNWLALNERLNVSFRSNIVGTTKVPASNGYYDNEAPGYKKANLTLTWINWQLNGLSISPQLVIKNLFDTAYAGVGRQDGRSDANAYHPTNNPNPEGFIPGYHPQPGRSLMFNLKAQF